MNILTFSEFCESNEFLNLRWLWKKPQLTTCVNSLGQIGSVKNCALNISFGETPLYLIFPVPSEVKLVPQGLKPPP